MKLEHLPLKCTLFIGGSVSPTLLVSLHACLSALKTTAFHITDFPTLESVQNSILN